MKERSDVQILNQLFCCCLFCFNSLFAMFLNFSFKIRRKFFSLELDYSCKADLVRLFVMWLCEVQLGLFVMPGCE